MSKKEMIIPNFRFTYGFLKQLADSTLLLIDRDMVQFTDRGFTPVKRTELVTAINTFSGFATDEQLNGIKVAITITKDTDRNALERQMRGIFLAARTVFGEASGAYREFGNADLKHQTEAELVRNAKMMVTTTTKYLTNLATEGITLAKVSALDTLKTNFDNSIDLQTQATYNRDNATEQRAILANNLYTLVIKYNDIGKDIWAEVSEAKYNDYVVYDTVTGTPDDVIHTVI
jgi:hypothetical protein